MQRTKNASWALDTGIISKIAEFEVPANGNFHPFFG